MFGNLLGVVLAPLHHLTNAFWDFWQLLQTRVRDDLQAALEYKKCIKPIHILRSIQLIFYTWFMHHWAHLTPPEPNLKIIMHHILMQIYVLPHLPHSLYNLAYPKKSGSTTMVPGLIPMESSNAISSSGSSSNGVASSKASTVSGLTTPTIPT